MQKTTYKEDQGDSFGTWTDPVSRFMYVESTARIIERITVPKTVADYGGANGLLKAFIPHAISIDIDPSKSPDICDNILTHKGQYELVVVRYVLHYLTDRQVINLFANMASNKVGQVLVIQFVNNDLRSKYKCSQNEVKYFRTEQQTQALLPPCLEVYTADYDVTPEFYANRLGIHVATGHCETIKAYSVHL